MRYEGETRCLLLEWVSLLFRIWICHSWTINQISTLRFSVFPVPSWRLQVYSTGCLLSELSVYLGSVCGGAYTLVNAIALARHKKSKMLPVSPKLLFEDLSVTTFWVVCSIPYQAPIFHIHTFVHITLTLNAFLSRLHLASIHLSMNNPLLSWSPSMHLSFSKFLEHLLYQLCAHIVNISSDYLHFIYLFTFYVAFSHFD